MKHFNYLRYVLTHKWHVFYACMKLGVPFWQALIHDWTKFTPIEWFAYVDRMAAGRHSTWQSVADTPEYNRAWAHHWQSNPHHWDYWTNKHPILSNMVGPALPMPKRYWLEMAADWYGAGMAQGKPEIAKWYYTNRDKRVLHLDTRINVEALLVEHPELFGVYEDIQ